MSMDAPAPRPFRPTLSPTRTEFTLDADGQVTKESLASAPPENVEDVQLCRAIVNGDYSNAVHWHAEGGSVMHLNAVGYAPLHVAVEHNHVGIASHLLQHAAAPDRYTLGGDTALHIAAHHGHTECVELLLRYDVPVDIPTLDTGDTPLWMACDAGHLECARVLLRHGAAIDARDAEGWTMLHHACAASDLRRILLMLELGADPATPGDYDLAFGDTPLHLAVQKGHIEVVETLLRADEKLVAASKGNRIPIYHLPNSLGRTPIHEAAYHGRVKSLHILLRMASSLPMRPIVKKFAEVSANPEKFQSDAEWMGRKEWGEAVESVRRGMINLTRHDDGGARDLRDLTGATALHLAVETKNFECMLCLLRIGVNIDTPHSENGETPLHYAAEANEAEILQLLILAGADIDVQSANGHTALHLAARDGHLAILKALLDGGAEVDPVDALGFTPFLLAAYMGHQVICDALSEAGASHTHQTLREESAADLANFAGHHKLAGYLNVDQGWSRDM